MRLRVWSVAVAALLIATAAAAQGTLEDGEQPGTALPLPSTPARPSDAQTPSSAAQPPADAQQRPFADRPPTAVEGIAPPEDGEEERPFRAVAGGSLAWDSNVFRLPSSVDAQSRLGR